MDPSLAFSAHSIFRTQAEMFVTVGEALGGYIAKKSAHLPYKLLTPSTTSPSLAED